MNLSIRKDFRLISHKVCFHPIRFKIELSEFLVMGMKYESFIDLFGHWSIGL
jgi:hypothetical protein